MSGINSISGMKKRGLSVSPRFLYRFLLSVPSVIAR